LGRQRLLYVLMDIDACRPARVGAGSDGPAQTWRLNPRPWAASPSSPSRRCRHREPAPHGEPTI